jgi:hypothetical protein
MNGWMWRLAEAEAINRQALGQKGDANRARIRLGQPSQVDRPRPNSARFGPGFLPGCFSRDPLFVCTCMWTFDVVSLRLRLESLLCKLRYFLVESLMTCMLTCAVLHDRLLKYLMNLSRKSPLSASFLRKQQTPKLTCESELDTSGRLVPLVRISNTCKC